MNNPIHRLYHKEWFLSICLTGLSASGATSFDLLKSAGASSQMNIYAMYLNTGD
ncbi:MAG: hypothetical protein J5819_10085 [Eubacterium sp.]|nr:hypothetical protein [Eubacterium sp.]